jgi:hypothetical protein
MGSGPHLCLPTGQEVIRASVRVNVAALFIRSLL